MAEGFTPIEVFCCYAHEDEAWLHKLEKHLSLLKRQEFISFWHNRLIAPGTDWTKNIDTHLETASVILLLVSADFFASDYCYGIEMKRALERQEAGEACVVPILVRSAEWNSAPFKHLQVLPSNVKPISQWRDRDAAFADVVGGIRSSIESFFRFSAQMQSSLYPPFWHVQAARNPFFTGREEYLRQISVLLKGESPASVVPPLALCGLGGIGKTQIAVEYAYRHRLDYQAIFWVEADSYETLMRDFVAIATALNLVGTHTQRLLPKKPLIPGLDRQVVPVQPLFISKQQEGLVKLFPVDQQKQSFERQTYPETSQELSYLIDAVKRWFDTQTNWLLILDNVENLRVIKEYLPPARRGHILLTTRSQSLGELALSITIEKMELEESTRFLLRKMKATHFAAQSPSTSEAAHVQAMSIAQVLDNVPLALDQARAYIEETGCDLAGYLLRYQKRRIQLLQRRGGETSEHPEPIATTVSLCFEKVERDSPAAANILRLCAFLHSSGVPEELIAFANFDPHLQLVAEDLLALDAAIGILYRFSLVNRISDTKMLVVHRLVQVILKDTMDEDMQRYWTKQTIGLINQVLSDGLAVTWQTYFPHVQSCIELVMQQKLCTTEAAQLLHQAGVYLKEQIQYEQAAQFLRQAIAIREQFFQQDLFALISSLDALAEIHVVQGQYDEALPLLQRTLSLREQVLGTDHFKIASNLDNLAATYSSQGKYEEAEGLFKRALAIREQVLGEEHLDLVNTLNHLALLHMEQEHDVEAELLLQRILAICAKVLGPDHPDTSRARKNYIDLLQRTGRSAEAEALAKKNGSRTSLPMIWNIPYASNPLFLGRERELAHIREHFQRSQTVHPDALNPRILGRVPQQPARSQPQVISGLGGIGKTQLALEYAYRYHQDYQMFLWANAESTEALVFSYISIAAQLQLPERESKEQDITIQAVKTWLRTHSRWLLILDSVDDLTLLSDFLPPTFEGHVLLTTRAATTGGRMHRLEIEVLSSEQGALLLLRRAGLIALDAELSQASAEEQTLALGISRELGGLPLALDQAGAYLEETETDLASYWQLYQQHRAELLQHRGGFAANHPDPVATTWSLSFQRVEEKNPAAADLLRVCAFLSSDAIAEEILTVGASFLGPVLAPVVVDAFRLNQAIEVLRTYSLVRRDSRRKSLSVHRLVQGVLQDVWLSKAEKQLWAERAMLAVNATFPHSEYDTWPQCERLLPHALAVAQFIEQYAWYSKEAGHLLSEVASYLQDRAYYQEAEPLFQRALAICEYQFGDMHSNTAQSLNGLAALYQAQGKYEQAESLYQRALSISEQQMGPEHPYTALLLNNLAELYLDQRKYEQSEPLLERSLAIRKQVLGIEHPNTTQSLDNLALLYQNQGKYTEAELLLTQALTIREQQLGSEHPDTAQSINHLAELYLVQDKYAEAEPLLMRAFSIRERQLGPDHPYTALLLKNLALLYHKQKKYEEAEPLYHRTLAIYEQKLRLDHPLVAYPLAGLANLYREQGRYVEAEPLYLRALHIEEEQTKSEYLKTAEAEIMCNIAWMREAQNNAEEARDWYIRALVVCEQALGTHHRQTTETRKYLIALLHAMGQHEEAAQLEEIQSEP